MIPDKLKPNLVIGCGNRPKEGSINLDAVKMPGVDVVWDLEKLPLPFPDESFVYIEAEDVLEHIHNMLPLMDELHRILKPNGKLWIRGPHGCYPEQLWKDPTHLRAFVPGSFDNWDPETQLGRDFGHYFSKRKFHVGDEREVNKGMEYVLVKI